LERLAVRDPGEVGEKPRLATTDASEPIFCSATMSS
jgi:hypothetical protein